MGNPENFQGNNTHNMPKPGNFLGIIYKGGIIVPILMSVLMMVITFSIERFITLNKAKGKGSISSLVLRVYQKLSQKISMLQLKNVIIKKVQLQMLLKQD